MVLGLSTYGRACPFGGVHIDTVEPLDTGDQKSSRAPCVSSSSADSGSSINGNLFKWSSVFQSASIHSLRSNQSSPLRSFIGAWLSGSQCAVLLAGHSIVRCQSIASLNGVFCLLTAFIHCQSYTRRSINGCCQSMSG